MRQESTLCELARLSWARPAADALPAEVAALYRAKARTHAHLATEANLRGDELGARRETEYARQAADHAAALQAGRSA